MDNNDQPRTFFIIFVYLFLASISLTILLPILAPLFYDEVNGLFDSSYSASTRQILYGSLISGLAAIRFLSAPLWGNFSDIMGRKITLICNLIIMVFGYFLSAIAVSNKIIYIFLLGQSFIALSVGASAAVLASILDITSPETTALKLRWVEIIEAIGFLIGPLLCGLLTNMSFFSVSGFTLPFYAVFLLSIINLFFVSIFVKETNNTQLEKNVGLFTKITHNSFLFKKNKQLNKLVLILMVYYTGFQIFFNSIGIFLFQLHHLTPSEISLFIFINVLIYIFIIYFIYPVLIEKYNLFFLIQLFFYINIILFILVLISLNYPLFYLFSSMLFWLDGLQTCILTLCFTKLYKGKNGAAMGKYSSIIQLSTLLSGLFISFLSKIPLQNLIFVSLFLTIIASYFAKKLANLKQSTPEL